MIQATLQILTRNIEISRSKFRIYISMEFLNFIEQKSNFLIANGKIKDMITQWKKSVILKSKLEYIQTPLRTFVII